MKIAGTRWTAAKFVASCAAAVLVEPSPTHVRAMRRSPRILNVSATPVTTGTMSPTCEMGGSTPGVGLDRRPIRLHERRIGLPADVFRWVERREPLHLTSASL